MGHTLSEIGSCDKPPFAEFLKIVRFRGRIRVPGGVFAVPQRPIEGSDRHGKTASTVVLSREMANVLRGWLARSTTGDRGGGLS